MRCDASDRRFFDALNATSQNHATHKLTLVLCLWRALVLASPLPLAAQLYKLWNQDKFVLALASTLNLDGTPDPNEFNQSGEPSLMDAYEYVMHGKVFKVSAGGSKDGKMEVFTSYGGLLMSLKGEPQYLSKIELDMRMYLLIKKVEA